MPELLGICDRICVMNAGVFVGEFERAEATQEKIMRVIMRKGERLVDETWKETGREAAGRGASMNDKTVMLPEARKHAGFLKANLREYGMLLSLLAIMLFFEFVTDGTLLRPLNLTNLVLQNSYIVIMALGMLLVIVTGHIDLSVGSVAGFIGAIAGVLMVRYGMHFIPAGIACLALGALIGAAQGYWVAYFKIPSFIVTLAGMLVFKGLALAVLQGQSVGPFSPTFQKLSSGFIPELFPDAGTLYPTSLLIGAMLVDHHRGTRELLDVRERLGQDPGLHHCVARCGRGYPAHGRSLLRSLAHDVPMFSSTYAWVRSVKVTVASPVPACRSQSMANPWRA